MSKETTYEVTVVHKEGNRHHFHIGAYDVVEGVEKHDLIGRGGSSLAYFDLDGLSYGQASTLAENIMHTFECIKKDYEEKLRELRFRLQTGEEQNRSFLGTSESDNDREIHGHPEDNSVPDGAIIHSMSEGETEAEIDARAFTKRAQQGGVS